MKKYLTLAAVLLFSVLLYSCDNTDIPVESGFTEPFDSATGDKPEVLWQKAFGGEATVDFATGIALFPDGGLVVAGITHSRATWWRGIKRYGMVLRLNGDGDLIWKRILGRNVYSSIYASTPLTDGGVLLGGGTANTTDKSSSAIWLVRLDKNGNTVWDKTFDSQGRYEVALRLLPLSDDNILVLGNSIDEGKNITPYAAIINLAGDIIQQINLSQLAEHVTLSAIMDEHKVIAIFSVVSDSGQIRERTKMVAFGTDMSISLLDESSGIQYITNFDGRLHVLGTEQSDNSFDQTLYSADYIDGLQNKTIFTEVLSNSTLTFAAMNQSSEWLYAATVKRNIPQNLLFLADKSGRIIWSVDSYFFIPGAIEKIGNDFIVAGAKDTDKDNNQAIWVARLKGNKTK